MRVTRAFPFLALLAATAAACGRSDLADELLIVEPYDAGDFDVSIGDDEMEASVHDASTRDAAPRHDASTRDVYVPPAEDGGEFEDATPPPPVEDAKAGECSVESCSSGCCYGNVCAFGTQDIACGVSGNRCLDCTAYSGTTCVNGACVAILR